jgi:hypothetical protein
MENYGMLKVVANYWKRVKSSHKGPYPEWPLEGDISFDDEQLDCEYVSVPNHLPSLGHLHGSPSAWWSPACFQSRT